MTQAKGGMGLEMVNKCNRRAGGPCSPSAGLSYRLSSRIRGGRDRHLPLVLDVALRGTAPVAASSVGTRVFCATGKSECGSECRVSIVQVDCGEQQSR